VTYLRSALCAALFALAVPWCALAAHVNVVRVDGTINSATADHIAHAIQASQEDGAVAVLIELDTPGGYLGATQDIVQSMLNARVPVIVYVSPRGAWAASAGAFITLAGHVAAMAPGTSIGAASPITASGGGERDADGERKDVAMEKAEKFTSAFIESIAKERKRNVEWAQKAVRNAEAVSADEALELKVIDVVAESRDALFEKIDGRKLDVEGEERTLALKGAEQRELPMSWATRFFDWLASPEVAYLLVMAGLLGIYVEVNTPGLGVPGLLGAMCLGLAAVAFQMVPFSWAGLLVFALGVGLVVAELFVTSFGLLLLAGVVCLLIGGSMLFDVPETSDLTLPFWSVLVPVVGAFAAFAALVALAVGRTLRSRQTAGVGELLGLRGRAASALAPEGKVFVRGEYWNATADEAIGNGEAVEVTAVEGLHLRVRRPRPDPRDQVT
jgi:membrane-bound serine protease (ClpP class)